MLLILREQRLDVAVVGPKSAGKSLDVRQYPCSAKQRKELTLRPSIEAQSPKTLNYRATLI